MATKKKTDCRQYRIGDFARYLGVTAEFLKHYQESGLLDVTQRASGYRYYGFDQSARILQYMRLRNYGISVKEMGPFLEGGLDEAVGCLDAKVDEMRAQIERMQAVVEEHERIRLWFEERCAKPVDWEVCNMEPHWFLYHTNSREFLETSCVYDVLKTWGAGRGKEVLRPLHHSREGLIRSVARMKTNGGGREAVPACFWFFLPVSSGLRRSEPVVLHQNLCVMPQIHS